MLGELCALGAALSWAISLLLFKKSEAISPLGLNLFKNTVALVMLSATMLALGQGLDLDRSGLDWTLLILSGVLGIALADTLTFMALRILGPALLAVVDCSYAPTMVFLSLLFLGESVTVAFVIGGFLVFAGVLLATLEGRMLEGGVLTDAIRERRRGVLLGVSGIVTMGLGIVCVKHILEAGNLLEITTVRLAAGVAGQLAWMTFVPADREALRVFRRAPVMRTLLPASILGTYVAMLFFLGGFKWTNASIASVLNQTSTVFTIVLARIFLAERISRWRAIGVSLAMGGAVTIFLWGIPPGT